MGSFFEINFLKKLQTQEEIFKLLAAKDVDIIKSKDKIIKSMQLVAVKYHDEIHLKDEIRFLWRHSSKFLLINNKKGKNFNLYFLS